MFEAIEATSSEMISIVERGRQLASIPWLIGQRIKHKNRVEITKETDGQNRPRKRYTTRDDPRIFTTPSFYTSSTMLALFKEEALEKVIVSHGLFFAEFFKEEPGRAEYLLRPPAYFPFLHSSAVSLKDISDYDPDELSKKQYTISLDPKALLDNPRLLAQAIYGHPQLFNEYHESFELSPSNINNLLIELQISKWHNLGEFLEEDELLKKLSMLARAGRQDTTHLSGDYAVASFMALDTLDGCFQGDVYPTINTLNSTYFYGILSGEDRLKPLKIK